MSIEQTLIRGEFIILLPEEKTALRTSLIIERRETIDITDPDILHRGQGNHHDLVIYKEATRPRPPTDEDEKRNPPGHICQFDVTLLDQQSKEIAEERRRLSFWFHSRKESFEHQEEFLHSLFQGKTFPRDYFSFIKRLMELLRRFPRIKKIRLEIEQHRRDDDQANQSIHSNNSPRDVSDEIKERLLDFLEQAFPNSISTNDLTKYVQSDEQTVREHLIELEENHLIKHFSAEDEWIRVIIAAEEEKTHRLILSKSIKELRQVVQPTIAILTVNYFEKLAVDAMIEEKITFLRQRSGESNVYTIGRIGSHHVVSTKLPLIGRTRTAQISIGSTTTRLLGTFQQVEHVFIVGCAGAIPHHNDANQHLRRGDIVVGYPNDDDYVYGIFEAEPSEEGYEFVSTCYKPKSFQLYQLLEPLKKNYEQTVHSRALNHRYPWETCLEQGIQALLAHHIDCLPPITDPLYRENVEVEHPKDSIRDPFKPILHFGMLAGGNNLLNNDYFKQTLREKCHVLCFDSEIDQVLAAIQGNRIESYMIIRGIADYHDGTRNKEWQPFSALCAAALMKTLIYQMPNTMSEEML